MYPKLKEWESGAVQLVVIKVFKFIKIIKLVISAKKKSDWGALNAKAFI